VSGRAGLDTSGKSAPHPGSEPWIFQSIASRLPDSTVLSAICVV
jgi:hypothetical protein